MLRSVLVTSLVYASLSSAATSEVACESSTATCGSSLEVSDKECHSSWASQKQSCKGGDQNVLFQGKVQVVQLKDVVTPTELMDSNNHVTTNTRRAIEQQQEVVGLEGQEPVVEPYMASAIEEMAMAPGVAIDKVVDRVPIPKGWVWVPAMASFFMLLMLCTDTHPDSYGMEEEEKDDTTRPPRCADRLVLFDIARFGLIVVVIWTQLMLAFGHSIVTSTLHEFVWPAWFFLAGVFGSSMAYESVARVICYSVTTNCLMAVIGTLFAFNNYHSEALPFSAFFGGAWVLWCLLFYRLTITPLFCIMRAVRVPILLLLVLIHACSYFSRLGMPQANIVVELHPRQIEHLLLTVTSYNATIQLALLHAPYFAAGLLMTPTNWNSLLSSAWFTCFAAANCLAWFVLTVTPLLCSLGHWRCAEKPWGVKLLIHPGSLSGFWEDAACYLTRMSAVLVLLSLLFAGASLLTQAAPKLASYLARCGSRIRYTIILFALWYMIRPCILSPPTLPFHRSRGMNDFTLGVPAVCIALLLTSTGTKQLFRWMVEPYWAKCWIEGGWNYLASYFHPQPSAKPPLWHSSTEHAGTTVRLHPTLVDLPWLMYVGNHDGAHP